jgi:hypothetical protein
MALPPPPRPSTGYSWEEYRLVVLVEMWWVFLQELVYSHMAHGADHTAPMDQYSK